VGLILEAVVNRRRTLAFALAVPVALSLLVTGGQAGGAPTGVAASGETVEYTVLTETGAAKQAAVAAVTAAGGTVIRENAAIGALVVNAPANGFIQLVSASPAVYGAAHAKPIGRIPSEGATPPRDDVESEHSATPSAAKPGATSVGMDPLDNRLWGLQMVRAHMSREVQPGDRRVLVGVLDSGVDATHPDIAPNYNAALSRNFTIDIPFDETGAEVDGPCEFRGCVDPPGWDDNGHGTHVAGTIAAAANGFGVSGVAPNVTIVSIRGGQDSGFVFLQPVLDALTYGADIGLDVINMSFYIDPWLYNCTSNPADSPEDQLEQQTTITAVNRALGYAHGRGVTLVNSMGNEHNDHGNPRDDLTSPDYPAGAAYPRDIDNATCLSLPAEGDHVIAVSALGPSSVKADYSNYGVEQTTLSAPGGYLRDGLGTPWYRTKENLILSTYPRNVLLARAWIDADGNITPAGEAAAVLRYCDATTCGYYRYLQGTSMAAPHVTGVAGLIVSRFGRRDASGLTLSPGRVEDVLTATAFERPCPVPPLFSYADVGRPPEFDALCEGTLEFNGFYGHGVVDAYAAVTRRV
jgi:subtilisin family serine protease